MYQGSITTDTPATTVDLQATVESGQTFCWRRADGDMFDGTTASTYYTVLPAPATPTDSPEVIRVQETPETLEWTASFEAADTLRTLLRLEDDLCRIRSHLPDDEVLDSAFETCWGLRMPSDPVFPTLIAFICSSQMQVPRIHAMQVALAEAFGDTVTFDGREYAAFPTPTQLAAASEDELRELKLGYRASWVKRTATLIADGEVTPATAATKPYEDAHTYLQQCVGVGDKVADCTLLYSLDFLNAVPIDTWMETALDAYYPTLWADSYQETSQNMRAYFGEYAGYAQSYLFHYLRTEDEL